MSKVTVTPGICGFVTTVKSQVDESFEAAITIESACANIARLAEALGKISVLAELRTPIRETTVYCAAATCRLHASCPVPSAILKAIEVAAGLALPADVHMTIER